MSAEHLHSAECSFARPSRLFAQPDGSVSIETLDGAVLSLNPQGELKNSNWGLENSSEPRILNLRDSRGNTWPEIRVHSPNSLWFAFRGASAELILPSRFRSLSYWHSSKTVTVLCGETRQEIRRYEIVRTKRGLIIHTREVRCLLPLRFTAIAHDSPDTLVALSEESGGLWSIGLTHGEIKQVISEGRAEDGGVRAPISLVSNGSGTWAFLDRDNYRLVFQLTGEKISHVGRKGSEKFEFDWPSCALFASKHRLLVADTNNDRVVEIDLKKRSFITKASRTCCPQRISRPVSIDHSSLGVTIVDRGNDRILRVGESGQIQPLEFVLRRGNSITAASVVGLPGRERIFFLQRGGSGGSVSEASITVKGTLNDYEGQLLDPQGMSKIAGDRLVISDTLNRRGLFLNHELKPVGEIDLSKASNLPFFLCRVPSVFGNNAMFIDYQTGISVMTNSLGKMTNLSKFDLDRFQFSHLRKIVPWGDKFVALGRGDRTLAFLTFDFRLIHPRPNAVKALAVLRAPADGVAVTNDVFLLVDKERDAVFEISSAFLEGCSISKSTALLPYSK